MSHLHKPVVHQLQSPTTTSQSLHPRLTYARCFSRYPPSHLRTDIILFRPPEAVLTNWDDGCCRKRGVGGVQEISGFFSEQVKGSLVGHGYEDTVMPRMEEGNCRPGSAFLYQPEERAMCRTMS